MITTQPPPSIVFGEKVLALRAEYEQMRDRSNLFPPNGRQVLGQFRKFIEGRWIEEFWIQDGTSFGQCVRLVDIPSTLSGDILRLHRDLPPLEGHTEIDGNTIRKIERPQHPTEDDEEEEDDSEDISAVVSELPLVPQVDPNKHFLKKGKYRSELANLLKCQGGACPGQPISPHIIQLLGSSSDGQLVFNKLETRASILGRHEFRSIAIYKTWILDLIEALKHLHSLGIVHRDLRVDNLLFSDDGHRLVVCDIESHWGNRLAPEIAPTGGLDDSGWTEKSDIYDIGHCIKGFVYANAPRTRQVDWLVPPPFDKVVEMCLHVVPEERPTLEELSEMVEAIKQ